MIQMEVLDRLVDALRKLPGVGRRSAQRMAVKIIRDPSGLAGVITSAIKEAKESLVCCSRCGVLTGIESNPCVLCTSTMRDASQLCVVEEPDDIGAIERSGGYRGRYHSLMGRISPMRGDGPSDLRIKSLVERVKKEGFSEVILALGTDVEGESTASYISDRLIPMKVKITRIAFGLPAGSGIGYSDPITLARAMANRTGNV